MQPATAPVVLTTVAMCANPEEGWYDTDVARALIGIGADDVVSERTLGNLLIRLGHTMTLPQVEAVFDELEILASNQMREEGRQFGFCLAFFTPTGDPQCPVALCTVTRWNSGNTSVDLFRAFLGDAAGPGQVEGHYFLVPDFKRRYP